MLFNGLGFSMIFCKMADNLQQKVPLVSIQCLVYNHEPYLRQCLDGFVMQKTNFPFEAIVHDDASTDGSTAIVREYAEKYPDIIKPIYETKNQYCKHDGSLRRIMDDAMHPDSKYVAMCEGDDYWIGPDKLQLQVDFLESHPDYSMCCNLARVYDESLNTFVDVVPPDRSGRLKPDEIINRGGLFISTCSLLYRKHVKWPGYPEYCQKCHVADYPLQIMCAMKGAVYCFDRQMSVYRINNPGSWSSRQRSFDVDRLIRTRRSEVNMLKGFANDYPEYRRHFYNRIAFYLNLCVPIDKGKDAVREYLKAFKKEIIGFNWRWHLHLLVLLIDNKYVTRVFKRIWRRYFYYQFT